MEVHHRDQAAGLGDGIDLRVEHDFRESCHQLTLLGRGQRTLWVGETNEGHSPPPL